MLYTTAKSFSVRPSQLLGIVDPYKAYCIDEAVVVFGHGVEYRLSKIEDKDPKKAEKRREAELKSILTGNQGAKFAAPPTHNVSRGVNV